MPIYATTSYVFENSAQAAGRFALAEPGNIYTRLMNPTTDVLEQRIAALEGGAAALVVASGSAAITYAVQNIAVAGDHIVSSANLYGGTYNLFANTLREQGISTTFVDPADGQAVEQAIQPNTKLLYAETLGNPQLRYCGSGTAFPYRPPSRHPPWWWTIPLPPLICFAP